MATVTPAMRQYHKIKRKNPDCIVLFQLGDFYEALYDDAKTISKELDIILTARKKREGKVPMAGVPVHALDNYLPKLVEKGYKVAVAAQTQDAGEAKGVVEREVVRIITPGTLTEESKLQKKENRYIAAILSENKKKDPKYSVSFADTSTGEFKVTAPIGYSKLRQVLDTINPKELTFKEGQKKVQELAEQLSIHKSPLDQYTFDAEIAYSALTEHFKTTMLKAYGLTKKDTLSVSAAGALLQYLENTQKTSLEHITTLSIHNVEEGLILDQTTIRNLELIEPLFNKEAPSLLSTIDRTSTPMGGRMLKECVVRPLTNVKDIKARLDTVEFFLINAKNLEKMIDLLSEVSDIERIVGKLGLKSIRPPHLPALKTSLQKIKEIAKLLKGKTPRLLTNIKRDINKNFKKLDILTREIDRAVLDEPAAILHNGKIFKKGYDKNLDESREDSEKGKTWIKNLEEREKKRTKIQSLKVRYNKVFGYYIEVSKANLNRVPDDYIRKQTLVNAERFITPELKNKEAKVLGAEDRMINMEDALFERLVKKCKKKIKPLQDTANLIAQIDVLLGFANLAKERKYTKPEINKGQLIKIEKGRHPVVESITEEAGELFVSNNAAVGGKNQVVILTGPNMSGKSTYIRQVALITLLAQMGSFVPAKEASIGVVDRVFARVGASDNLALGESTFMVEMLEAANILHNASNRSLVILDEVGRGTSTYDGMSLAWAIVEYLHEKVGCKTLFATHYHELTDLEQLLKRVKNYHVIAKDDGEKVIFLRKVKKGKSDRSYGVHVAKLAGVPAPVVRRAKEILDGFENGKEKATQLNLPLEFETDQSELVKKIQGIDIENTTPLEALNFLKELLDSID